jgi:hypothetical protein
VGPYVAATLHSSVSPTSVVAGSTGNTLTFTFTSQGNSGNGTSTITVPSGGWTAPAGHVSVTNVACTSVALGVSGNFIPVNYSGCPNLNNNTAFTVTYASVTSPTVARNYTFTVTGGDNVVVAVTAGSAAKLVFTTQPGNGTGGSNLSTQPVVTVQDTFGNTVTTGCLGLSGNRL